MSDQTAQPAPDQPAQPAEAAGEQPSAAGLPEGTAHSHADDYHPDRYEIITVTHPSTGAEHRFTFPKDNVDAKIRYELPDGTLGEVDNPNSFVDLSEEGDVMWDAAQGHFVQRVTSSENGGSGEATNPAPPPAQPQG